MQHDASIQDEPTISTSSCSSDPITLEGYFQRQCRTYCHTKRQEEDFSFFDAMLLEEEDALCGSDAEYMKLLKSVRESRCYPLSPLYKWLGTKIHAWVSEIGEGPHVFNENNEESDIKVENINEVAVDIPEELVRAAKDLKSFLSSLHEGEECNKDIEDVPVKSFLSTGYTDEFIIIEDEKKVYENTSEELTPGNNIRTKIDLLLSHLTKELILKFLGVGRTVGSVNHPPPSLQLMYKSFTQIHHPKSTLTVGARALSKHCHRSSDCWWGESTGTIARKNQHALEVLTKVLVCVVWVNVHTLPHDVWVCEVRCAEGYGLRWGHDGMTFRGFLEPQMVDGHEKGWKH